MTAIGTVGLILVSGKGYFPTCIQDTTLLGIQDTTLLGRIIKLFICCVEIHIIIMLFFNKTANMKELGRLVVLILALHMEKLWPTYKMFLHHPALCSCRTTMAMPSKKIFPLPCGITYRPLVSFFTTGSLHVLIVAMPSLKIPESLHYQRTLSKFLVPFCSLSLGSKGSSCFLLLPLQNHLVFFFNSSRS